MWEYWPGGAPDLGNRSFVIEGHASAEGDYGQNLQLSQKRAERISRELVRHGVSAERLMPVGYGEAEAVAPGDAAKAERSLDRRVVFRMRCACMPIPKHLKPTNSD